MLKYYLVVQGDKEPTGPRQKKKKRKLKYAVKKSFVQLVPNSQCLHGKSTKLEKIFRLKFNTLKRAF
jgi:hypothetical protein